MIKIGFVQLKNEERKNLKDILKIKICKKCKSNSWDITDIDKDVVSCNGCKEIFKAGHLVLERLIPIFFPEKVKELKMIKIGFTGTRHGMSDEQLKEFENLIKTKDISEFHHGMCIGSDKQAHDLVKNSKLKIVGHPPIYKKFISNCDCDIIKESHDYLKRNKNIVDETDILIATPDCKEKVRSGTWSTVRYARRKNKEIYIIHKNGRITIE